MSNWPLVVPDKLGVVSMCRYTTRSGTTVWCRSRSTDVNEAVAILSGLEYPHRYLRLGEGSVVVDLGANIGCFVLYLMSLNPGVDFRGIAFEPFGPNFDLLNRNMSANGISTFSTVRAAVTGLEGSVRLHVDPQPDRVRVAGPAAPGDPTATPSHRLGAYCRSNGITSIQILKMDVEGAEYEIVESDLDFIASAVDNVLVEYHELGERRTASRLREMLDDDFAITTVHERSHTGVLLARNRRL